MKKRFLLLITFIFCLSNAFAQVSLNDISKKIAAKKEFSSLITRLDNFSNSEKDFNTITELGKKDVLNKEERSLLLKSLGFNSESEALDFDIQNYTTIQNILQEFDLENYENDQLSIIFEQAIMYVTGETVGEKRTCREKLKSCRTGAWGVYIIEHAGCASAGVGIGAASFWCAGCLGAGVWAACATGASMHMASMLDDCQDKYDDCIRGN